MHSVPGLRTLAHELIIAAAEAPGLVAALPACPTAQMPLLDHGRTSA
jgi:hypothetical protein